jgi:hypothetical protein
LRYTMVAPAVPGSRRRSRISTLYFIGSSLI